jgi:excisionase family DNA binding protein
MVGKMCRVDEVAERWGMSTKTIFDWIGQGRIDVVRIGKRALRIPESEVERILQEGFCPRRTSRRSAA